MSAVPQPAQPSLADVSRVATGEANIRNLLYSAREPLRAPFPFFGGKGRIAHAVWDRFGDVKTYVEPFAGSLAVLLARPHAPRIEVVNDADVFIANFWRSLQRDPYGVAQWASEPVNECDLHARHLWLINRREWRERMKTDPDHYDIKIAGWWVWGICQWIGAGWCEDRERVKRKIPNVADGGLRGVLTPGRSEALIGWMLELAERLRGVRVCCGDWRRVCTPAVTFGRGACAVFLDPPYAVEDRDSVYNEESRDVAHQVREWALDAGRNPDMLIALCGYDDAAMPGWTPVAWKANGGYGNQADARGRENATRETIWFSPACALKQGELF